MLNSFQYDWIHLYTDQIHLVPESKFIIIALKKYLK
jgi:hypothetical protein